MVPALHKTMVVLTKVAEDVISLPPCRTRQDRRPEARKCRPETATLLVSSRSYDRDSPNTVGAGSYTNCTLLLLYASPSTLTSIAANLSSLDDGVKHATMLLLRMVAAASSLC
jgi:hypothetical protein